MTLSGWFNPQEARLLQMRAGTSERSQVFRFLSPFEKPTNLGVAIHDFNPPFAGSVTEPDVCPRRKGETTPSLVMRSAGWGPT